MRIIVVGGAGTIGSAVVDCLSARHDIVVAGRRSGDITVDISSPDSVRAMYQQIGRFDALACAAGEAHFGPFETVTEDELALGAADHFSEMADGLFSSAPYRSVSDPFERLLGYIDFRAAMLKYEIPQYTCLLGTMVQETYLTHPAIRQACDRHMSAHVAQVAKDVEGDTACTADLAPRVSLVGVPEDVDPTQDLEIEVTGDGWAGDTELGGVADLGGGGETDYLPSAGWTDVDGQFVVLTWGSSSCAPVIENTEATSATEITVTFATPPADQVCTMDMAPRAVVTSVLEAEDDADMFAILTGGEFDNIRVPIYPN